MDLEERLAGAGRAVRTELGGIAVRHSSVFSRRTNRRKAITYVVGLAALSLMFVSAAVFASGSITSLGSQSNNQNPLTYTVDDPDWELISVGTASDGLGTSHTLFDQSTSETVPRRFWINTGTIAADRRDALSHAGLESTSSFTFAGAEAAIYETDPASGPLGFASIVVLWTRPDGSEFAFLFEGVEVDEAQALISSLKPVDQGSWQSMLAQYEPPVTTTILAEDNGN